MTEIAAEGLILVSSMTEQDVTGGSTDADTDSPDSAVPNAAVKAAPTARRRTPAPAREDAHVSQVLRTVYQRAVEEDIPSEMLDLLSKLD